MTPQSTRDRIFRNQGLKDGAMYILCLVQHMPLCDFLKEAQEYINDAAEVEMKLTAELQKSSNPPDSLL